MNRSGAILSRFKLPERDANDMPTSLRRFGDGGQARLEIPWTEGPRAMEAVRQSAAIGVGIQRRYAPDAVASPVGVAV